MGRFLFTVLNWNILLHLGMTVEMNETNSSTISTIAAHSLALIAHDPNSFWTFNESADISKYENFDHSKFMESELNILQPAPVSPTTVSRKQSTAGSNRNKIQNINTRYKNTQLGAQDSNNTIPSFENNFISNVTAQEGSIAILPCHVRNLGDRPVTWIRRRDWHIITSGVITYSTDDRYQVIHNENSDNWDLQIKYATKRDNGTYECQVPHAKGKISQLYNLHVLVPTAYILGSDEYHVGVGSTINLVCIIENSPIPPQYVLWYHNSKMINYEFNRGGISVTTDPGLRTHSRLVINNASPKDSGNYTCSSSNAEPDTTYVFVSQEGDNTAAIQRHDSSTNIIFPTLPIYLLVCFVSSVETIF